MPETTTPYCLYCEREQEEVPLMVVQFKGSTYWICPQHLPILIHQPQKLEDKLPGAGNLDSAEHHH